MPWGLCFGTLVAQWISRTKVIKMSLQISRHLAQAQNHWTIPEVSRKHIENRIHLPRKYQRRLTPRIQCQFPLQTWISIALALWKASAVLKDLLHHQISRAPGAEPLASLLGKERYHKAAISNSRCLQLCFTEANYFGAKSHIAWWLLCDFPFKFRLTGEQQERNFPDARTLCFLWAKPKPSICFKLMKKNIIKKRCILLGEVVKSYLKDV